MEQRPRTPGHRVSTRSRKIRTPFAFRIWQVSSVLTPCRWYTVQGRIVVDLRWATQGGAVLPPQHGALPATPDRGNHRPLAQCADASRWARQCDAGVVRTTAPRL